MTRCESVHLVPDAHRVITKPFLPHEESSPDGSSRMHLVLERILSMPEREVAETLADARERFDLRHRDLDETLKRNFGLVAARLDHLELLTAPLSSDRRDLIGAYFTHEYSIEAAALGNPSIVLAPDQSDLAAGEVRFVMSLRSIGEGHTSSIEFRSGIVDADASVRLDAASPYARTGDRRPHSYDKRFFMTKLDELSTLNDVEEHILARLDERFTMAELRSGHRVPRGPRHRAFDLGGDDAGPALVGIVQLPDVVPGVRRHLRTRPVPERADGEPRDGGRPIRPFRR